MTGMYHFTSERSLMSVNFAKKRFSEKSKLQKHSEAVHSKEKQHEQEIFQGPFSHKYSLQNHMMAIHLKEKLHDCVICKEFFQRRHICMGISRQSTSKRSLMSVNFSRKKLQAISKSTPRQSIPWQLAIHLKEKLHECGFCHKRFSLKQSVQKHIAAIHLKEKHNEWEFC